MVIIRLVNTMWGVPTTLVVVVGSLKLVLKILPSKTPLDPRPKFVGDLISIPPLTEFVLGATTISTHVVGMTTLNN